MRNGNFSGLPTIYDPTNIASGQRLPFLNNQIPTGSLDPVAVALLKQIPFPNLLGISALRLGEAITERRELSDGYTFRLSGELMYLLDAARWVSLERLCYPFLTFRLETTGSDSDCWLMLAGPPDAKSIIREALDSQS
jgi:hypothetical protein